MRERKKIFSKLPLLSFTLFTFLILTLVSLNIYPVKAQKEIESDRIRGQILVRFKSEIPQTIRESETGKQRARIVKRLENLDVLVLKVPPAAEEKVIAALSQNPTVEYAEPDYVAEAFFTPNDTYFESVQWGLENTGQNIRETAGTADADINAPMAWETTQGGVRVAVLDTGIDQDHEDLTAKIILQRNFSDSFTVDDLYGHGTHVAGIIAAVTNNGMGVAGGCPKCELINVKVLGDGGSGFYSDIINGIIWAAANGAKVINMSFGGPFPSKTLERAINYAWNRGTVLVAAAGNSANQSKNYPAAYKNVVAVTATDNKDQKASFSSFGAKWVDLAAPGVNIFSTLPNHPYKIGKSLGYDFGSGTSMAAPFAAATAALVWSTPYGTSPANVRSRMEETADKIAGTGAYWSAGRLNAATSVSFP